MNRPSLYAVDIWTQWEKGVLEILEEALSQLWKYVNSDCVENDITVELHKLILRVRYDNQKAAFGAVMLQTQNQPLNALEEQENQDRLLKKPDLQWIFNDEYATVPEKSQRYFTIECKCLSTTTEEKKYVENGISRFVLAECGYGAGEKSAAMIGYIKAGTAVKHLSQVNIHNGQHSYPLLDGYLNKKQDVYRYEQKFKKREFEPQNFALHHLWTDISKVKNK